MFAYKTIVQLDNNCLQLVLPNSFNGKKVEIIVLENQNEISDEMDEKSGKKLL